MGVGPILAPEALVLPLFVGEGPEGELSKGVVLKIEVSEVVRLLLFDRSNFISHSYYNYN